MPWATKAGGSGRLPDSGHDAVESVIYVLVKPQMHSFQENFQRPECPHAVCVLNSDVQCLRTFSAVDNVRPATV